MKELFTMSREERSKYLQSKFSYYKAFNRWFIIIACLSSVSYFVSDCQLFGRFASETLIPRTFIIIPMFIYIIADHATDNYQILSVISQVTLHCIMWCTIWAIYYLPDKTHASEGFIIMHLLFLAGAFAAPFVLSTISHWLLLFDILASNLFNHYANLDIMLSLAVPCLLGITLVNYSMSSTYYDSFATRRKLEESLVLDPLTNTYNRNIMIKLTNNGRFTFDRTGDVSVLMLDIDFFKQVNDRFGHDRGDIVLKSVANTIQSCVRGNDYVIRWGGEEFVVLMPACTKFEAAKVAERIRKRIIETDNTICPITISIGVADYDTLDYNNAINHADKALYVAKQTGRNKVVSYTKGTTTDVLLSNGLNHS
ncbi:MAG: GGDEF domain-containing protein [Lachnospiraceae bacterium]|nr:GGDEF domain-containing protein [Lachnospiraceae bacterium]